MPRPTRSDRRPGEYADLMGGWAHPDVDPEQFARQFMALWDGLQAHWLTDPSVDLGAEVDAGLRALARRDAMRARVAINQLL